MIEGQGGLTLRVAATTVGLSKTNQSTLSAKKKRNEILLTVLYYSYPEGAIKLAQSALFANTNLEIILS